MALAGGLFHGFDCRELLQASWPEGDGMARLSLEATNFCSHVEGVLSRVARGQESLLTVPVSPSKASCQVMAVKPRKVLAAS